MVTLTRKGVDDGVSNCPPNQAGDVILSRQFDAEVDVRRGQGTGDLTNDSTDPVGSLDGSRDAQSVDSDWPIGYAHQGANLITCRDGDISECHVGESGAGCIDVEQSHFRFGIVIEVESADVVSVAVERAVEAVDRGPCIATEIDISSEANRFVQAEIVADGLEFFTRTHQIGKVVGLGETRTRPTIGRGWRTKGDGDCCCDEQSSDENWATIHGEDPFVIRGEGQGH